MAGIIWRNLICSSEERNTSNNRHVGGRAGCDAITMEALINVDNDAASCYDRIIPNLSNLLGQKKGLHCNVTFMHATTLAEAKFKLKTAIGVSDDFYQHCKAFLVKGLEQRKVYYDPRSTMTSLAFRTELVLELFSCDTPSLATVTITTITTSPHTTIPSTFSS
eukprot:11765255-Ditylum_brightwellii.AAC.1